MITLKEHLDNYEKLSSITMIELGGYDLRQESEETIKRAANLIITNKNSIKDILISNGALSGFTSETISKVKPLFESIENLPETNVIHLDLSNNNLGNTCQELLESLSSTIENSTIAKLALHGNQLGDPATGMSKYTMKFLNASFGNPSIKELHCGNNALYTLMIDVPEKIKAMFENTNVNNLNLSFNNLWQVEDGLPAIVGMLAENQHIEKLSISGNDLGNSNCFIDCLQKIASSKSLRHLDVSTNNMYFVMTDEFKEFFDAIVKQATLQELDLSGNKLCSLVECDSEFLSQLEAFIAANKNMKKLSLRNNDMSFAAVQRIKEAVSRNDRMTQTDHCYSGNYTTQSMQNEKPPLTHGRGLFDQRTSVEKQFVDKEKIVGDLITHIRK